MYGSKDLKPKIDVTEVDVECPVIECKERVERQRSSFRRDRTFRCPVHEIYISPSTFEYEDEKENLLWSERGDLQLLDRIKAVKRESRMSRDNSEDAVTWNVFRFLEKKQLVSGLLAGVLGSTVEDPEVIYWSFSQGTDGLWPHLEAARNEFELVPSKGSEPDIIVVSKEAVVFIEAKVTAPNTIKPSNYFVKDKYTSGGGRWWNQVFVSDFDDAAVKNRRYELARFWLLGTWIAKQLNRRFALVSLVLDRKDGNIESELGDLIKQSSQQTYHRMSWETIYDFVARQKQGDSDYSAFLEYFEQKTLGYSNGKLREAFRR